MPLSADISPDQQRIILTTDESFLLYEERIKGIIGASLDKVTENWSVPLTWSACTALRNDFGIDFDPSEALNKWGYDELNARVKPSRDMRSLLNFDGLDITKTDRATAIAKQVDALGDEIGLYPYQKVGATLCALNERFMVLDEQGTGKTAQTISALRALHAEGNNPFPVLVVAPSSVKRVWETQFAKWFPGLTVINVRGSAAQRRKQLATPAHVYIISYASVAKHSRLAKSPGAPALKRCVDCHGFDTAVSEDKCQAHSRELNEIGFQTVVVDEAHRILNPKSSWTRAIWSISDIARYFYALTGTPIEDHLDNFWALLRATRPDEFLGKTQFLERFAVGGYNPWGVFKITGINPAREPEFLQVTLPHYRRVLKDVALPFLPPIVTEIRMVEMVGAQAKAYRDMEKKMIAELSTGTLTELSALTQTSRLMQLASSYLEIIEPDPATAPDPEDEKSPDVRLSMPSNKISAFMEDVLSEDFDQSTKGVVVFAQSRPLLEMLATEMDKHDIKYGMVTGAQSEDARSQAVDAFQAGETKYILVSIAAGGAGLTLTAADTMVFLQRSWSRTGMTQAEARAHRLGSEIHESIRIIHYMSEGTREEKQLATLDNKTVKIQSVLRDQAALLAWMTDTDTE